MRIANFAKLMKFIERRKTEPEPKLTPERILFLLKAVENEYSWCPDWLELEKEPFTPVFLYCDLMHGGTNHSFIADIMKKYGEDGGSASPYAFTERRYAVWVTREGERTFPVALTSDAPVLPHVMPGEISPTEYTGMVKGRVYLIPSHIMKDLDRVKHHGVYFKREYVRIRVPYTAQILDRYITEDGHVIEPRGVNRTPEEIETIRAWMYVGIRKLWDEQPLYNMQRCASFRPNVKERDGHRYEVELPKWRPDEPFYFFRPRR